jgi:hypothetical protein
VPPSDLSYASGVWHYTRGLAFAAMGKLNQADREREELHKITRSIPTDRVLGTSNNARKVSELAETVLTGEIASARGDHAEAIARLSDAVQMQDALIYDEPPIWYFPVREALGAELIAAGQAAQAEAIYRSDLKIIRVIRALCMASLEAFAPRVRSGKRQNTRTNSKACGITLTWLPSRFVCTTRARPVRESKVRKSLTGFLTLTVVS